ncbi:hypothetical protein NHQ30_005220 [Ciborinia camelliae]|nr:hypothetical protein NHQ30_005220 [Ciborinia camelliae]
MSHESYSNIKPEPSTSPSADRADDPLIDEEMQSGFPSSKDESLTVVLNTGDSSSTTGTVNIDFVVIHGLFGRELNRDKWFDCGPDSWLTQYANSLESSSRIMEFTYNASVIIDGDLEETMSGIRLVALSLLSKLKDLRKNELTRAIMFLGCGMGGVIVKDALVAASSGTGDCHLISVYEEIKTADNVDNHSFYNYTIGVPFERRLARSEEDAHKNNILDHLRGLQEDVMPPQKPGLCHERLLLSLAAPLRPLVTPFNETWWFKDHMKYEQLLDSTGPQILYLHGNAEVEIQKAAEQVFYHLEKVQRTRNKKIPVLFFEFDSWDIRRCTLSHMLTTFITQLICHYPNPKGRIQYMSDRIEQERGWTLHDLISWFTLLKGENPVIVISRFDECDIKSRKVLLDLISYTARMSERTWKIIVTGNTSKVLQEELRDWSEVDIVAQSPEGNAENAHSQDSLTHRENLLLHKDLLCLPGLSDHDRSIIVKHLVARRILPPKTPLWQILASLNVKDGEGVLESTLDSYFRCIPDQRVAKCALMWLLHSKRPMTKRELGEIMFLESEDNHRNQGTPSPTQVESFAVKLELWFAGFIEVENHEIYIQHGRLREIFRHNEREDSNNYWWNEASVAAHFKMAKSCLEYLSRPDIKNTQANLKIPNGTISEQNSQRGWGNLLSYAVQYWFQHFQAAEGPENNHRETLVKILQDIDLESWSRMFWGLANPITRSRDPWKSAFPIFAAQGEIDLVKSKNDEDFGAGLIEACLNGRESTVQRMLDVHEFPASVLLDAVQSSAAGGHEQLAINLIGRLPSETKLNIQQWGPSILWRSARINLHYLADTVLSMGCPPDSEVNYGDKWKISPLSQCSWNGHLETIKVLVKHKANVEFPGFLNRTPIGYAALLDHADIIAFLATHAKAKIDSSDIDDQRPIHISCIFGSPKATMELLRLGANINPSDHHKPSPLTTAVSHDNEEIVKLLLDRRWHADVNIKNENGQTALHIAICKGNAALVRLLLDNNCDPNEVMDSGFTDLHAASTKPEILKMLVEHVSDLEVRSPQNATALMIAAAFDEESARILIEHKADVNAKVPLGNVGWEGWTPVFFAADNNKPATVTLLAEAGADLKHKDKDGNCPLHLAVHGDALSALLEFHTKIDLNQPNNQGDTPLHLMENLTMRNVQYLVRGGAEVNIQTDGGCTPLQYAVKNNKSNPMDIVSFLLEHGADPNLSGTEPGKDDPPLHWACHNLSLKLAELLVKAGADLNMSSFGLFGTPIIATCLKFSENTESEAENAETLLRYLIEKGADVKGTKSRWGSALSVALMFMKPKIVHLLLEEGALVHREDSCGRLPIHLAAIHGGENLDIIIEAGGDIRARDKLGRTVLHYASQAGRSRAVKKLLEFVGHEMVDEEDIDGWTPLCWAVRGTGNMIEKSRAGEAADEIETIRILIDRGANRFAQCRVGQQHWSPLQIANYRGADENVLALLKAPNEIPPSENVEHFGVNLSKRAFFWSRRVCGGCLWLGDMGLVLLMQCILHAEFPHHTFEEHGPEFEDDGSTEDRGPAKDDDNRNPRDDEPEENPRDYEPEELVERGNDHEENDVDEETDSSESEDD